MLELVFLPEQVAHTSCEVSVLRQSEDLGMALSAQH